MTTTATPPTPRQAAVYAAVVRHMAAHGGQCPSMREVCAVMGFTSPNGLQCHYDALEKKGLIVQPAGDTAVSRGIRVVGLAEALEAAARAWANENGVDL